MQIARCQTGTVNFFFAEKLEDYEDLWRFKNGKNIKIWNLRKSHLNKQMKEEEQ